MSDIVSAEECRRWMPDPIEQEINKINRKVLDRSLDNWSWTWIIIKHKENLDKLKSEGYNIKDYWLFTSISWKSK